VDKVEAPFTPDQVASLNAYQVAGVMHPFTCGGGHTNGCGEVRLIAAEDGWRCASDTCDYRQGWAHAFMADWSWRGLAIRTVETDETLAAEFETHAAESLEIANETFDAVVQSWPKE
jgi:hypothetical protein